MKPDDIIPYAKIVAEEDQRLQKRDELRFCQTTLSSTSQTTAKHAAILG